MQCSECDRTARARGLCNRHYQRFLRHGHVRETRGSSIFHENFAVGRPDECWTWRGSFNDYGYGRFGRAMAHRLVYEQYRGPIPSEHVLDHLCRNPACVNPDHLEVVKQATNIERGLIGYALRKLCRNGLHDITDPASWYLIKSTGRRTCLECKRANDRRAETKRVRR